MRPANRSITSLCCRVLVGTGALAVLMPSLALAQTAPLIRERFESGGPRYGFSYMFPTGDLYTLTHASAGGADGTGAAHFRMRAGREQYNLGWVTRSNGHSFAVGDAVYIRFRVRFDDDHLWLGDGSLQNKFILLGEARATPVSRIIVHNEKPHDTSECSLGHNDYDGRGLQWMPRDFGLNYSSWEDPAILGKYSSLSVKVNISDKCTPPILITRGQWYHVQIYAKSSSNNTGVFKVWVNNNDFGSPNSQASGFTLGTYAWNGEMTVGGFMTHSPTYDSGYRLDDVELALDFDPNWAIGSPPSQTQVPNPPVGLRVE